MILAFVNNFFFRMCNKFRVKETSANRRPQPKIHDGKVSEKRENVCIFVINKFLFHITTITSTMNQKQPHRRQSGSNKI